MQRQTFIRFAQSATKLRFAHAGPETASLEAFHPTPFRAIASEPLCQSFVAKSGPGLLNAVDAIK
jgi:hypothetical protein